MRQITLILQLQHVNCQNKSNTNGQINRITGTKCRFRAPDFAPGLDLLLVVAEVCEPDELVEPRLDTDIVNSEVIVVPVVPAKTVFLLTGH